MKKLFERFQLFPLAAGGATARRPRWRPALALGLCALFWSLQPTGATTYYIDASAGSDGNSGTSTSAPWQHCPGDASATGVAAGTALSPGDTVIFKGGVSYTSTITVNWSGTPGNWITYDGNSAGTWGSGRAIIDEQYLNTYGFFAAQKSNLIFNNFVVEHCGGVPMNTYANYSYPARPLPVKSGYGLYMVDAAQVTVANCLFQEMAYWTNQSPVNTDITGLCGTGVLGYSGLNITITNCEFTRMAYAIHLSAGVSPAVGLLSSNNVVTGCNIHNYINWGIISGPADNSTLAGIIITNNTLHDMPEYGDAVWWGGTEGGGGSPHVDPIFMGNQNAHNAVVTNVVICNNTFYENGSVGGMTAWIFLTTMMGDVTVCNNVLKNSHAQYGLVFVQDATFAANHNSPINFKIYNNSVYADYILCAFRWSSPANGDDPLLGTIRVKNNAFYMTNGVTYVTPFLIEGSTNRFTECDNNVYYVLQTYNQHDIVNKTPFSAWQALGYDAHGRYGDLRWANITYGLEAPNSSLNDLHLTARSTAVGAGANLSSVFQTDLDGNARPLTGAWDAGAYQFRLLPPTNLQVTPPTQ